MRYLGLDVGSKTIGLAVSDEGGLIAQARQVLQRQGHEKDAASLARFVQTEQIHGIVVGMPYELDGRVGHRARLVQQFIAVLARTLANSAFDPPLAVELWDERFSTAAAERTLLEANLSRTQRKQRIDAVAAQFILQGWLDAQTRLRSQDLGESQNE